MHARWREREQQNGIPTSGWWKSVQALQNVSETNQQDLGKNLAIYMSRQLSEDNPIHTWQITDMTSIIT